MKTKFIILSLLAFSYSATAQLEVEQGTGVNSSNGGYGLFGDITGGSHMTIDGDDIQKKSGPTSYGTMHLNYYGGNVDLNNGVLVTDFTNRRVGIGTTAPTQHLHIQDGNLRVDNGAIFISDGTEVIDLGVSNGDFYINAVGGSIDNEFYIDDENSYVGINTSTPAASLHVKQTSTSSGIRTEHNTSTNYWTTYIDGIDDYNFAYNGTLRAYIEDGAGSFVITSDRRLKKNISPLEDVLEKLMQLKPSKYYYKSAKKPSRKSWGFIAQEVAEIFPELVMEKDGYNTLAYDDFAIMSVKAIQELKGELDEKATKMTDLEEELSDVKAQLNQLKKMVQQISLNGNTSQSEAAPVQNLQITNAYLAQNSPNPFKGQTSINYFVPENTAQAQVQITDLHGQVLKTENLQAKGHGTIVLDISTLPKGNYTYSLMIDGEVMSTKQMILMR